MGLLILNPGHSTTIQDRGRPGYRAWGVTLGGSFDATSAAVANALLGNARDSAVLEMTLIGGTYKALKPLALSLAGAPMEIRLCPEDRPDRAINPPAAFALRPGDRLIVGGTGRGARAYLGIRGGWQTSVRLGSRSSETRLKAGDVLDCAAGWTPTRWLQQPPFTNSDVPIRVTIGPEPLVSIDPTRTYRVGVASNRMGLRLEGPPWSLRGDPDRISAPVAPGAIQVAGGLPILLGVACGTMGGYPHVAQVISPDLDRVGQLRPGEVVRFENVSQEQARELDRHFRAQFARHFHRIATAASDLLGAI